MKWIKSSDFNWDTDCNKTIPCTRDEALARIAWHIMQIKIIADKFGLDPYEWLADKE